MANTCIVSYVFEGNKKTLKRISDLIEKAVNKTIPARDNSSHTWQGNVLYELGASFNSTDYIRGFFCAEASFENGALRFDCEEKWHRGDFAEILCKKFPSLSVYWIAEEGGCEIYETNDAEGKYFAERYYVDTCINGEYESEYFTDEEGVYKWLTEHANCKNMEDVEAFNEAATLDDFIYIHEFEIAS